MLQLTSIGNYILFGPNGLKVYKDIKVTRTPMMERRKLESLYVMSALFAYVDKTWKNETTYL